MGGRGFTEQHECELDWHQRRLQQRIVGTDPAQWWLGGPRQRLGLGFGTGQRHV